VEKIKRNEDKGRKESRERVETRDERKKERRE